jgi:hypothetical protein
VPAAADTKVKGHIQRTGETEGEFMERAIDEAIERDVKLESMGIELKKAIDERRQQDNN